MRKSTITHGSGSTKDSSGHGVISHTVLSQTVRTNQNTVERRKTERLKDDTTSVQSQDVTHTFQEVQKTNQLLMRLIDHMKKAEHCVEAIEDKLATSISSSSTAKTS